MPGAALWDGDGAGIQIVSLTCLLAHRYVGVPVKKYISGTQRRHFLGIPQMSVRDENCLSAQRQQHIIGEHGEFEHHLINLRVAVAAHPANLVFHRIEHRRDILGGILPRKVVARAVIEYVPQQYQALRLLFFVCFQKFFAIIR